MEYLISVFYVIGADAGSHNVPEIWLLKAVWFINGIIFYMFPTPLRCEENRLHDRTILLLDITRTAA